MTTGAEFKDWVLIIAGNIFIVIFILRVVGSYAKREWGELLTNLCAAILIAGFIYLNEQTMQLFRNLFELIFG